MLPRQLGLGCPTNVRAKAALRASVHPAVCVRVLNAVSWRAKSNLLHMCHACHWPHLQRSVMVSFRHNSTADSVVTISRLFQQELVPGCSSGTASNESEPGVVASQVVPAIHSAIQLRGSVQSFEIKSSVQLCWYKLLEVIQLRNLLEAQFARCQCFRLLVAKRTVCVLKPLQAAALLLRIQTCHVG